MGCDLVPNQNETYISAEEAFIEMLYLDYRVCLTHPTNPRWSSHAVEMHGPQNKDDAMFRLNVENYSSFFTSMELMNAARHEFLWYHKEAMDDHVAKGITMPFEATFNASRSIGTGYVGDSFGLKSHITEIPDISAVRGVYVYDYELGRWYEISLFPDAREIVRGRK